MTKYQTQQTFRHNSIHLVFTYWANGGVILINNQAFTILFTTFSLYRFTILSNKVLELFPPNKRSFTFCRILEILDAEEFSKIVISLFVKRNRVSMQTRISSRLNFSQLHILLYIKGKYLLTTRESSCHSSSVGGGVFIFPEVSSLNLL